MRRTLATVVVIAAVLLVGGPAAAKVPAEVEITGPGLEAPLLFTDGEAFEYANLAGIAGYRDEIATPRRDVGPRYVVRFTLLMREPREAVQFLYPFAAGGALVYTPPDQRLFTGPSPLRGGWARTDGGLVELLAANGLRPVVRDHSPAAPATTDPERRSVLVALAVLGSLLVAAAVVDRRRRLASI